MIHHLTLISMRRSRAAREKARKAAERRWKQRPMEIGARRMAYAIMVEGARPEQIRRVFQLCGIKVPGTVELYRELRGVCAQLCLMAKDSMRQEMEKIPPNTIIAFDGSWSQRRNARYCLFTVMTCQTKRIIESVVLSKNLPETSENYCEASNMMESLGLSLVIPSLRNNPNIVGYVHDNDGRARKMIREAGWNIREYLDPGHAVKSFNRKLQNFNRKNHQVLKGIEDSLRRWLHTLLKSALTTEQKVCQWQNSIRHYAGDHSLCLHGDVSTTTWDLAGDPVAVSALKKFLDDTQFIIECCTPQFHTNAIESFHNVKGKFASKEVRWGFSWEGRMMAAVLEWNRPGWCAELYLRLGLDEITTTCAKSIKRNLEACVAKPAIAMELDGNIDTAGKRTKPAPIPLKGRSLAYKRNPYMHE